MDERAPRTLPGLLAEATVGVIFNEAILASAMDEAQAIHPHDLFGATTPESLEQAITSLETRLEGYDLTGKARPKHTVYELAQMRKRLATCQRVARLRAARQSVYPDCFCFGLGGKDPQVIYALNPRGRRVTDGEAGDGPLTICSCPDGVAEAERQARVRLEILARAKARHRASFWESAQVPKKFILHPLSSHPDRTAISAVRAWARGDLGEEQRPGLFLLGPNQRGKSTVAYHLALAAIERGDRAICEVVSDLFGKLTDTFNADRAYQKSYDMEPQATHQQLLDELKAVRFLLLDDLGVEKEGDYTERTLTRILDARLVADEPLTTVVTTNLKVEELNARFGDRAWARLVSLFTFVAFTGQVVGPMARGPAIIDTNTARPPTMLRPTFHNTEGL